MVYGARISLEVGITVVVVSGVFGTLIGSLAGFYGGFIDKFLSGYVFNVFLAFPGLLLAIALVAFLGAGQGKLIAALCVIGWVSYARVMRGQVLKVREYDYVLAARALGASDLRLLFTHILRAAVGLALPVMVAMLAVNLAFGVLGRAAPALNPIQLGLPTALLLGLFLLALLAGELGPPVQRIFDLSFDAARRITA